jgi:hypothetical protein
MSCLHSSVNLQLDFFLEHVPTCVTPPVGPLRTLNDGTQQYGGVRVIRLRADPHKKESCGRELLTAGSDGRVIRWQLKEVTGTRKVRGG